MAVPLGTDDVRGLPSVQEIAEDPAARLDAVSGQQLGKLPHGRQFVVELQREVDDKYGKGLVVLEGFLTPVGS
ncbi:hypothetical protein ACOZ38_29265 [Sphaerisporangium viridialbum]|uniref:hypothetical protein n=1 Tax=Sphaerisporangium viridialbum TaxID=46189 RepID=UPI003C76F6FC